MNMKTKQFITKNFIFVLAVLLLMAFTGCKKTYEVKFDSAGGSSVETQEVKKNGTVQNRLILRKKDMNLKIGYWMEQLMILMLKLHLVLH